MYLNSAKDLLETEKIDLNTRRWRSLQQMWYGYPLDCHQAYRTPPRRWLCVQNILPMM